MALAVSRPEPLSSLRPFSTFLLAVGAATLLAALHALLPARIHRLGGAFVLLAALLIVAYVAVDTVDAFSTRMSWTGFGEVGGGPISGMLTLAASVLPLAALSRWKAAPFVPAVTLLLVLLATRGW